MRTEVELSAPGVPTEPFELSASQAAAAIRNRQLGCEELTRSCLSRIAAREADVKAWLYVDADSVLRMGRECDKRTPISRLHGLPWGVKDVYDTVDMPTTQNSRITPDVRPGRDAASVSIIRHYGSLILGKTDTVEFAANGRYALTRNPLNLQHTPGGSSSGSAAAVADFHVPLALGTQTIGSHIRPASFNGIYGMKPTWSVVNREGFKMGAPSLDTVGWYGRSVDDLILVAEAFQLYANPEPVARAVRDLRVGVCRSPVWSHIEPSGGEALLRAAERLASAGVNIEHFDLPPLFDGLHQAHRDIYYCESGRAFLPELLTAPELLAPDIKESAENKRGVSSARLAEAYDLAGACRPIFDSLFGTTLDVILTPSAPGEAPKIQEGTGTSVFNGNWTLLHVPCINIPAGRGARNMPVGVSLVGPRFSDGRLLDIANLLAPIIDADPDAPKRQLLR